MEGRGRRNGASHPKTRNAPRPFSHTSKAYLCGSEPGNARVPYWAGRRRTSVQTENSEQDHTDSRIPTETNLAGRPSELIKIRCRRSFRHDVNEMLVRLNMHRAFYKLSDLTAETRRIGSRLCREVHTIGVAGKNHVRSVRPRAQSSPASAAPLESGQVDSVPCRH